MKMREQTINLSKSDRYIPDKPVLSTGHFNAFRRFVEQGFFQLWYDRMPVEIEGKAKVSLKSYEVGDRLTLSTGGQCRRIRVVLGFQPDGGKEGFTSPLEVILPLPTPEGVFYIDGVPMVFPAITAGSGTNDMSKTRLCYADAALSAVLSESLNNFLSALEERIKYGAVDDITPDELAAGIPIQESIDSFFYTSPLFEKLDCTNPVATLASFRKVRQLKAAINIDNRELRELHLSMYGRLDPFSTPESEVGLYHTLSVWADADENGIIKTPFEVIRSGRPTGEVKLLSPAEELELPKAPWDFQGTDSPYVWVRKGTEFIPYKPDLVELKDVSPTQGLSHSTILTPFLGSDDGSRAVMAANMAMEAVSIEGREVPWVMSGAEEAVARWTKADSSYTVDGTLALGANVLTAFLPWEGYNYEDAIVVSSALVERGTFTSLVDGISQPLEVGDKLVNRHGLKGVVAKIVDRSQMPQLPDGTPVDMLLNPMGVPSRMTFGPILEASAGLAAATLGTPVVSPPYCGATIQEVRGLLKSAGLPASGMFHLALPENGKTTELPVTVGYVYMLKLKSTASAMISKENQKIGLSEIMAMIAYGAASNAEQALTGADSFKDLVTIAKSAHVKIVRNDDGLCYSYFDEDEFISSSNGIVASPRDLANATDAEERYIELPLPVTHPWDRNKNITVIPIPPKRLIDEPLTDSYRSLLRAVMAQRDILDSTAPAVLARNGQKRIQDAVDRIFGLPDSRSGLGELIRQLSVRIGEKQPNSFKAVIVPGPELSLTECGIPEDILGRMSEIAQQSHILLNRTPTLHQQSLQALRAVTERSRAVRIHPMACRALDADFDGDQVAVYGLRSRECAEEALSLMTPARNIYQTRSGDILVWPTQEMVYGLAYLSNTSDGRKRIMAELPEGTALHEGERDVNKTLLRDVLCEISRRSGAEEAIKNAERLMRLGFNAATESGISVGLDSIPDGFFEKKNKLIAKAKVKADKAWSDGAGADEIRRIWLRCAEELWENVIKRMSGAKGPARELLRIAESGARGTHRQLSQLIGARGLMGTLPAMESFAEGNSAWAHFAASFGVRNGMVNRQVGDKVEAELREELLLELADIQITNEICPEHTDKGSDQASPLTCTSSDGICRVCYGEDPVSGQTVSVKRTVGITAAFAITEPLLQMSVESHKVLLQTLSKIKGAKELSKLSDEIMAIYEREGIPMLRKHVEVLVGGLAGRWSTGRVLECILRGGDVRLLALARAAAEGRTEPLGIRECLLVGGKPSIS